MATVERSIVINAPPDAIDAIALDATRLPEWYVGIDQSIPDDLYPEMGGRVELVYKVTGVSFSLVLTVQELAHGHHISYQMFGMMIGTHEWRYAPEGEQTRLIVLIDYNLPSGILGRIADKLVFEQMNAHNLEASLENLKALVEG